MTVRTRGRQYALQMLYQHHYTQYDPSVIRQTFWRNLEDVDGGTRRFTAELVDGVLKHREAIDLEIAAYLKGWTIDRITPIDRFIMEIAILELMVLRNVPWKVAVDEAVQLASAFSSDNSPKFVNGVLHAWSVANNRSGNETDMHVATPAATGEGSIDWRDEDEDGSEEHESN